jgi:RimJ/RimL family protein N-acetyltransferase
MPYLFFRSDSPAAVTTRYRLIESYFWVIWHPSRMWPQCGAPLRVRLKFLFRYALAHLGLFKDEDVGAVCAVHEGRLAHYSAFTPRYWRFPFLRDGDLQIGDTWTDPADRGKGLASAAIGRIVTLERRSGRRFWYVVDRINEASIRVVEKAGFNLIGRGAFVRPLGIKLFGAYRMQERRALPRLAGKRSIVH